MELRCARDCSAITPISHSLAIGKRRLLYYNVMTHSISVCFGNLLFLWDRLLIREGKRARQLDLITGNVFAWGPNNCLGTLIERLLGRVVQSWVKIIQG